MRLYPSVYLSLKLTAVGVPEQFNPLHRLGFHAGVMACQGLDTLGQPV